MGVPTRDKSVLKIEKLALPVSYNIDIYLVRNDIWVKEQLADWRLRPELTRPGRGTLRHHCSRLIVKFVIVPPAV